MPHYPEKKQKTTTTTHAGIGIAMTTLTLPWQSYMKLCSYHNERILHRYCHLSNSQNALFWEEEMY